MTYTKVNHTHSLFLHEKGQSSAKAIIFLHGVGSSGNMWSAHLKSFNHYHCIAPDLPGNGKSNHIEWTNLDEVTEMMANIIKKKCNQKAHLVGLSLGGALAANLLVNYPTLVDRAIIDGCSLKPIKGSEGAIIGISLISLFIHKDLNSLS